MAAVYCFFQVGGQAWAGLSTDQNTAFGLHIDYANTEDTAGPGGACGTSSIPTTTTGGSASANEQIAFNYFITQGLNAVQSAAIIGNIKGEDGSFNPESVENGGFSTTMTPGKGYGLSQWTDSGRQQGLTDFARKNNGNIYDLGIQLGYIWYELNNTEKNSLTDLRAASDIVAATTAFQNDYERPLASEAHTDVRIKAAQDALALYGSSAISSGGTSNGCGTTNIGVGTGKFTTNTSLPAYPGLAAMLARAQALNDPTSPLFKEVCASQGPNNCTYMCDYVTGAVWGYKNTGYDTAWNQWLALEAISPPIAHPGDRNPPVGAVLFYGTGKPGHAAVYLGNNKVLSTDVLNVETHRVGGVYITDASKIENGPWNLQYAGWADPHYAGEKASW